MEGTETGFTESLILEEQRLSVKLLAIRNLIKLYDNNLESETLGLNTKYPLPSQSKYKFLIEQLYTNIWDIHSHDDYQSFTYIVGQVINYYAEHPEIVRKEIPNIEWDIPPNDY